MVRLLGLRPVTPAPTLADPEGAGLRVYPSAAKRYFLASAPSSRAFQCMVSIYATKPMDFTPDPTLTPQGVEALERSLRENGLRPEDNIFSCGIVAAREE